MKLNGELFKVESVEDSRYSLTLNADHAIYQAHFPGQPITPGVCLVQIVKELLSLHLNCPLYTGGLKNVKFTSVVSPLSDPRLNVLLSGIEDDGTQVRAQALLTGDNDMNRIFAKMSLIFEKEPF